MNTGHAISQEEPDTIAKIAVEAVPDGAEVGDPVSLEPDLDFIRALSDQAGGSFKKCFQCGTCSGTCELSPDKNAFPRKEMAWATWGLKDRLLTDPDVWLCHQCNDCSAACPRGGRPGDVLAAVRRECILHYAVPRFLARWLNQPRYVPLLLAIPAVFLSLALLASDSIGKALDIPARTGTRIVYSYSSALPQWLLNGFFLLFGLLLLFAVAASVFRFWRALRIADIRGRAVKPARGLFSSVLAVLRSIFAHDKFTLCTAARLRYWSHMTVLFGFLALSLVTAWVITAKHNPLIQGAFAYPFNFWSPWKMLANLGGTAIIVGCLWMAVERLRNSDSAGRSTYSDWFLLFALAVVTLTGFLTEVLHYLRLEPHRHAVYFLHLVLVFGLLVYLPYSKLAHLLYRTTAMVYAEHTGRDWGASPRASHDAQQAQTRQRRGEPR